MKVGDKVRLKSTVSWGSDVVAGIIMKVDHRARYLNHYVKLTGELDGTYHNWYSERELELLGRKE